MTFLPVQRATALMISLISVCSGKSMLTISWPGGMCAAPLLSLLGAGFEPGFACRCAAVGAAAPPDGPPGEEGGGGGGAPALSSGIGGGGGGGGGGGRSASSAGKVGELAFCAINFVGGGVAGEPVLIVGSAAFAVSTRSALT